ncbi:MAG: sigma 54-interacting transcriptional regulator [Planctomycetota bacterium]|nr:sigma 54-interacting transcriptional regulator [Planctomycetota bacterium]
MGNLLVIDSDTAARGIVRGRLADAGHLVHEADDPEVGVRAARDGDYDGVLLSFERADTSEELCSRLLAQSNPTTTPLIAYCLLEEADKFVPRALDAGVHAVVSPSSGPQLERVVVATIAAFGRVANLVDRQRALRVDQRRLTEQLGGQAPTNEAPRPRKRSASPESALILDPGMVVRWCDRDSWVVLGRNCVGSSVRDLVPGSGLERFVSQAKTVPQHGIPLELPSTAGVPGRVLGASVYPLGKGWRCLLLADLRGCESHVAGQVVSILGDAGQRAYGVDRIEGSGPVGTHLRHEVAQRAADRAPVLLLGETGTERELLARVLHYQGAQSALATPIMDVRCSAHSSNRVDRLLFGSGKDGAGVARPGLFELLTRGTIVLHEVDTLTRELQARLLATLASPDDGAPRVIATTTRDLNVLATQRDFDQDLAALLMGQRIDVPPLRNRGAELTELVNLQLEAHGLREVDEDAYTALRHYAWPGNLLELEDTMQRALRTSQGGPLRVEHLPSSLLETSRELASADARAGDRPAAHPAPAQISTPWTIAGDDPISFEVYERKAILRALHACRGDRLAAARMLRLGKSTLYRKIRRYGIE